MMKFFLSFFFAVSCVLPVAKASSTHQDTIGRAASKNAKVQEGLKDEASRSIFRSLETAILERLEELVGIREKARLGALGDVADLKEFIKSGGITIKITPPYSGVSHGTIARYENRTIFLNMAHVGQAYATLKQRKDLSDEEILDILALKLFPTLAHEIQHGITGRTLKSKFGAGITPFLENEIVAFIRQLRASESVNDLHRVLPPTPNFDKQYLIWEMAWKWEGGVAGIRKLLARSSNYGELIEIEKNHHQLNANIDFRVVEYQEYLDLMQSIKKDIVSEGLSEEEKEAGRNVLNDSRTQIEHQRRMLEAFTATRKFIQDPKQLDSLRQATKKMLREAADPLFQRMMGEIKQDHRVVDQLMKMGKTKEAGEILDYAVMQMNALPQDLQKKVNEDLENLKNR